MSDDTTAYHIRGRISDASTGLGLAGLRVEAWDEDLVFDDLVGTAMTDDRGDFEIDFDRSYFAELFADRRPDLFFKVVHERRLVHTTEDSVLWNVETTDFPVEIEVDLPLLALDDAARARCGAGVRQLLLMSDAAILAELGRFEAGQSADGPSVDRGSDPAGASIDTMKMKSHPILGSVVVRQIEPLLISVRAIVNFGGNVDDLRSLGIEVHSHVHDVFTVSATRHQLAALAVLPATRRINTPRRFEYDLDVAVPQAEVDQIHTLGTEGDGVIIGVIDSGLNVRHHTFRDPVTRNTRVVFHWVQDEMAGATGDSPEGHFAPMYAAGTSPFDGMNYGILYTAADIDTAIGLATTFGSGANQIADDPTEHGGHGSHVTGIAAGNGMDATWAQGPNVGAAPEADIVFVVTDLDEAHVIDAINFVFEIARRRNQAAVVNMSFGGFIGPHDGLSDYDRAQDDLIDTEPGWAIVRTAGNDNDDRGFRTRTIAAGQTEPAWDLDPNDAGVIHLDIWYSGPELEVRVANGAQDTGWVARGGDYTGKVNGKDLWVLRDREIRADLRNIQVVTDDAVVGDDWTITMKNLGTSNVTYWAWSGEDSDLDGWSVDQLTLSDTACCKRVLTVGACRNPVGSNPELINAFSGCGPTLDGRVKPEVTAIGTAVNSASGSSDTAYVGMGGTSQAAPMVSGSIALLLENEPSLAQDQIKGLLLQSTDRTNLDLDPAAASFDQTERNQYGFGRLRMLTPFNHSLPLRDVDVWVRTADDDYGVEPYIGGCFCEAPEVRILDATGTETNALSWGDEYTVSVRVHNLGDAPAVNTRVRIKYTRPWLAPDDWVACQDNADTAIEDTISIPALSATDHTFTQRWRPEEAELPAGGAEWGDHYCLLIELNDASHADDPLLYDDSAAAGSDPWTRNIKGTNNVALRNLHIH